jgi:hypothetical protein
MKMVMLAALIAAGSTAIAQADTYKEPDYPLKGWYAGLDVGGWRFRDPIAEVSVTGFSYSPFLGYQINRYIGVEGAYLGGTDAHASIDTVNFALHANVAQAAVIGSLPLWGYAGLYARAGIAKWWSTATVSFSNVSLSADDNGCNGVYGAGVYEHFDSVASRIEWTRSNVQGTRVNRLSVAAYWHF